MTHKSKKILSEISPGELLDKISILEIKIEKVKDKNSLEEIKKEHKILKEIQTSSVDITGKIRDLFQSVKNVNVKLWNTEDKLRICEKNKDFGKRFIELARSVYFANDERAELKSKINKILKSNIIEIKQYDNYKV